MLEEGIMLPPSPFEAFFLATSHAELGISIFEEKLNRVFRKIREG
jgi:glutamate-1-semialdehyde aminotransferase